MNNPFTSEIFITIWSKHFNEAKSAISFHFISNVQFVKHWLLPLHVNAGKNLTKGINYKLNNSFSDYKGKTFLIYDVPTYFKVEEFNVLNGSSLRLKKLYQYKGFLMDLTSVKNHNEYINSQFSSKNRREFRSNQRRLEECFKIKYSFLHGETNMSEFRSVFDDFFNLLQKRFSDKHINYHHLTETKWNFYNDVVYKMLLEKKASILVIYNETKPIGITLNFHSDTILFETITVFDPDYYKFSIGKTSIIKLLEWCFENNYKISDFSKGDFDYKHKWANLEYEFYYHIFYDSSSLKSRFTAKFVEVFFNTKLYLREQNLNALYRKCIFLVKGSNASTVMTSTNYKTQDIKDFEPRENYVKIDYKKPKFNYILQSVYSFMFAHPEPIENIYVYHSNSNPKIFVVVGSNNSQKVSFK